MDYLDYVMTKKAKRNFSVEEKERWKELLTRLPMHLFAAQMEGLLHLEETAWEIPETDAVNLFLKKAITLIVDGNDSEMVRNAMGREIVFLGVESYEAYLCYIALQGVIAIQLGYSRYSFNDILVGCFQSEFREEAREVLEEAESEYVAELRARNMAELPLLRPRKSENPYLPLVMDGLSRLDEERFISIISALSGKMTIVMLEYAPEELRTRILENVSQSVWEMYLEDTHLTNEDELSETLNATARLINGRSK